MEFARGENWLIKLTPIMCGPIPEWLDSFDSDVGSLNFLSE
jgi:hypothetical protein